MRVGATVAVAGAVRSDRIGAVLKSVLDGLAEHHRFGRGGKWESWVLGGFGAGLVVREMPAPGGETTR
jgi:hypothetical protein